jgi:hypothetical protein
MFHVRQVEEAHIDAPVNAAAASTVENYGEDDMIGSF